MPSGRAGCPAAGRYRSGTATICFCPATAITGAQGLAANAVIAPARSEWTTGCFQSPSGTAGFSGRPPPAGAASAADVFFLVDALDDGVFQQPRLRSSA